MTTLYPCEDCTARFADESDADTHEHHTGHTVRAVDVSPHAVDVRRTVRLDAQKPRGPRERALDGQGPPRGDY